MPRLQPSLLRRARRISPHLAVLLPACRDLGSARNELRWIREHVLSSSSPSSSSTTPGASRTVESQRTEIARLCAERGRGVPLQYVLGSQPFGPLDIACRPGVLIPRPETEAWVYKLAGLLRSLLPGDSRLQAADNHREELQSPPLRIIDFCTGTGCVALLLTALLRTRLALPGPFSGLIVRGFDLETRAVALARRNLALNAGHICPAGGLRKSDMGAVEGEPPGTQQWGHCDVRFERADVFSEDWKALLPRDVGSEREGEQQPQVDILISNPPYISTRGFNRDTGRSVRNHEPKLALVPDPALLVTGAGDRNYDCAPEDVFYARLLRIADRTRAGIVVFEVGDLAQAMRVVALALAVETARGGDDGGWNAAGVEIWRDWPDMQPDENDVQSVRVADIDVPVRGSGHGRTVVLRRDFWNKERGG